MDIDKIKLIVDLTMAKVSILKIKADAYEWACHVNEDTREQLLMTLTDIDSQLAQLRDL